MIKYAIDGRTLLSFIAEDYELIGIKNKIHIKKILLELERFYPTSKRENFGSLYVLRREKIRKHKIFDDACIKIQRAFRGYMGRKYVVAYKEKSHRIGIEQERMAKVAESGVWWSARAEVFQSIRVTGDHGVTGKSFGRRCDHLSVRGYGRYEDGRWIAVAGVVQDGNPTRKLTEKLAISGYDARRQRKFLHDVKRVTKSIQPAPPSS